MKTFVVGLILMTLTSTAVATTNKDVCQKFSEENDTLSLPQKIDYTSEHLSTSTIYVQQRCIIYRHVSIDSDALISGITKSRNDKGLGTHRDTVLATVLTKEWRDQFIKLITGELKTSLKPTLSVPGVTVYTIYEPTHPIPPFTITLESASN